MRVAIGLFALVGVLFLCGMLIFAGGLDYFGRLAADRILANAVRPARGEMPITAGAIPYGSGDIQIIGGMGQGLNCSLPPMLERLAFPVPQGGARIGLEMRQACVYHDYCYRHGAATYGYTQADCDFALQVQAFRLCGYIEKRRKPNQSERDIDTKCMRDARLVTLGVRLGGSDSFRNFNQLAPDKSTDASDDHSSSFFEFDSYPHRFERYVVFRVADAPQVAGAPEGVKAIYKFSVTPSGILVAYSIGLRPFEPYARIPGNPNYRTAAPVVVRAGLGKAATDWFVWWQRIDDNETTGRLVALAPARADAKEYGCLSLTGGCSQHVVMTKIGKVRPEDPQLDLLQPADLGAAAVDGISLATLRQHSCLENAGNTPCFTHVLIKTDLSPDRPQPQEPLRINDRVAPTGTDHNRYRNFASLPFIFYPPSAPPLAIAWTRRDERYQEDAVLRRAAVDPGKQAGTNDDKARSLGTALLKDFGEKDEPGFLLGRSTEQPTLVALVAGSELVAPGTIAMRTWRFPASDNGDKLDRQPTVKVDEAACIPRLDKSWLQRPPQVLGQSGDRSTILFTRLVPQPSQDRLIAKAHVATLSIGTDGRCSSPAVVGVEIERLARPAKEQEAIEIAFARISRVPLLLADVDGDGFIDAILPEGAISGQPLKLCSIRDDGTCR